MRARSLLIPGLLIPVLFGACSPREVSQKKLISLIEHNPELNQTREVNGITVQLRYCPYQLMVEQELQGNKNRDKNTLAGLKKKYDGQTYFRLSFSKDHKEVIRQLGSFQRYSDMLQVFSFELGKFINVTTEKNDTLPLKDYAFEQDFGMSAANTSLLVFNKPDLDKANLIQVNIGEFGLGIGDLQFVVKREEMNRLPELKYAGVD